MCHFFALVLARWEKRFGHLSFPLGLSVNSLYGEGGLSYVGYIMWLRYVTLLFIRPAFQDMIGDIEAGKVNCVIVKDLSRFGRDYIDTGKYLERYFPDQNVRFISISDNIDSFRRGYDLLLPLKNIFNEQYSRDISQKVHAAVQTKQHAGEFVGAFSPYGYQKCASDKNRLMIDEYAAGIVRRIFDLYVSGVGKIRIADLLNEQNILCPSEYKKANGENYRNTHKPRARYYWTYSAIDHILKSEMYLGNMVQGRSIRHMRGKPRPQERQDWIIVAGTHEAILDRVTWDKAQSLLRRRVRSGSAVTIAGGTDSIDNGNANIDNGNGGIDCSRHNHSILAGFLKCGDCGRALRKKSGAGGSVNYRCGTYVSSGKRYCTPHYISQDLLENIILADVNAMFKQAGPILTMAGRKVTSSQPVPQSNWDHTAARNCLMSEMDKIRQLKKASYGHFQEGLLTREEYIAYRQDYQKKADLLSSRLNDLNTPDHSPADIAVNPWIEHLLKDHALKKLDRDIILQILDEIKIFDSGKIVITYRFSDEAIFK